MQSRVIPIATGEKSSLRKDERLELLLSGRNLGGPVIYLFEKCPAPTESTNDSAPLRWWLVSRLVQSTP